MPPFRHPDPGRAAAARARLVSVLPGLPVLPGAAPAASREGVKADAPDADQTSGWVPAGLAPVPPVPPAPPARPRLDPGRRGVAALAAVALISVLVAGGLAWHARPKPLPAPPARVAVPSASPSAAPPLDTGMVVHVAGAVTRPGVVTLPPGSRVLDALKAAGGVRRGASTGTLNLARRLVDGEQLLVGASPSPMPAAAAAPDSSAGSAGPSQPLDLNAATVAQLDALPGVGPVLAQRIIDHRTQHGPFRAVDQLREVEGIGERRFAELRSRLRV